MDNSMPILLVPGVICSPRIFAPVIPPLWRFGPVTVANHEYPRFVQFADSLPMTATGKVLRRELRALR